MVLGRADPEQVVTDTGVVDPAAGAITATVNAIGGLVGILFVGIYVAAQPGLYHHGLRRLVPVGGRDRFDDVL